MSAPSAEIFDLGYQGYDGARTGRWNRRAAIWRDGTRISLGLGRGAGAKVAPWLLIAFALVPALLLVVVAALTTPSAADPDEFDLPSYAEYYEFAIVPLSLFAAVVAPLLVCPDRRDGVLPLYAARPIAPTDYAGARWTAFFVVAAGVAWLPEAILFGWNLLDARDTGEWIGDNWDVLPRFLVAGALFAFMLTALALLVSSFTSRRAYAAIGTLAVLFVGAAVGGTAEGSFSGPVADAVSLVSLNAATQNAAHWIFADELPDRPVAGWVSALWVTGVSVGLTVWYLRRMTRIVRG